MRHVIINVNMMIENVIQFEFGIKNYVNVSVKR